MLECPTGHSCCAQAKRRRTAAVKAVQCGRVLGGAAALLQEGGPQRRHLQHPAAEQEQVVLRATAGGRQAGIG